MFDSTNIFGYTGSPVLKKLQKRSQDDWHCYDAVSNKKAVLMMTMTWAETFNFIKNVNMQRGCLPEPEDVLNGWTDALSLSVVDVNRMSQKMRDIDEGRCAKVENRFRIDAFDKEHAHLPQAQRPVQPDELDDVDTSFGNPLSLAVETKKWRTKEEEETRRREAENLATVTPSSSPVSSSASRKGSS